MDRMVILQYHFILAKYLYNEINDYSRFVHAIFQFYLCWCEKSSHHFIVDTFHSGNMSGI